MQKRLRSIALLLAALLVMAPGAARGQANTDTFNKQDGVLIERITPRDRADIPLPATFSFHLELKVQLKTTPTGTIEVRFLRGRLYDVKRTEGMVEAAPAIRKSLSRGRQRMPLASAPLELAGAGLNGDKLYVIASLRDGQGKEVSTSWCTYRLSGSVRLRPNPAAPQVDRVDVLNCTPPANSVLPSGTTSEFEIRFYYSVKSVKEAFVNLEFGDPAELRNGVCWYSAVVPLPQGTGIVEVRVHRYFAPYYDGRTMGISMPLRLVPLGPSATVQEIKPFIFSRSVP